MAEVQNDHPFQIGTGYGAIGIGVCNTYSNQIDAVKISNGPDAGRPVSYTHLTLPTSDLV